MKSRRYLVSVFIAILAAVILLVGSMFLSVAPVAYAQDGYETQAATVWLSESADFTIEDGVVIGLSEDGQGKVSGVDGFGINFPKDVTAIGERAFKESSNLVEVVIPANITSIGKEAFLDCQALETLEFEGDVAGYPDENADEVTKNLSIGEESFKSCPLITSIHFPLRLSEIGNGAFLACLSLNSVYLPDAVDFTANEGDKTIQYFPVQTYLIYNGTEGYDANIDNTNLTEQTLTYLIKLNFKDTSGAELTIEWRLYKKNYYFVRNENGIWQEDLSLELPLQEGYKTTVWYDDSGQFEQAISIDNINANLVSEENHNNGMDSFAFFALVMPRANFIPSVLEYNKIAYNLDTNLSQLVRAEDDYGTTIPISNYSARRVTYNNESVEDLCDAGTYKLYINISDTQRYGEWTEDVEVEVVINKKDIDLSLSENLHWWTPDYHVSLSDGTLYEHTYTFEGVNYKYYSVTLYTSSPNAQWQNWTFHANINNLKNAIVYRRGTEAIKIELTGAFSNENAYSVDYSQHTYNDYGKYLTTATLEPTDNYTFVVPNNSISNTGMSLVLNEENGSVSVEKEWYIVRSDKLLLDSEKSLGTETGVEYAIPSWTFGDEISVKAPRLQHGQGEGENEGYFYSFELILTKDDVTYEYDIVVCTGKKSAEKLWSHYINKYMPSGSYVITVRADGFDSGNHPHWWNGQMHNPDGSTSENNYHYNAIECNLYFTVANGSFDVLDGYLTPNAEGSKVRGNAGELDLGYLKENGFGAFFGYVNGGEYVGVNDTKASVKYEGIKTSLNYENFAFAASKVAEYGGFWSNHVAEFYDEAPEFSFNLSRMFDSVYMTANNPEWANYIVEPSDYHVYYVAKMKNYDSAPALTADRYERYYTISLYSTIYAPKLDRTEYVYNSGRTITAAYSSHEFEDGLRYLVFDNTAIEVGSYEARAIIGDKKHYHWAKGEYNEFEQYVAYKFNDDKDLLLPYTVNPLEVSVPAVADRYYSGGTITIDLDVNENSEYYIIHDPEHENGQYLSVGDYAIILKLRDAHNYVWEKELGNDDGEVEVYFHIRRAPNKWTMPVYILPWDYMCYNASANLITASATEGVVHYFVTQTPINFEDGYASGDYTAIAGLEEFELNADGTVPDSVAQALNRLRVGTYFLYAFVEQTENYSSLEPSYYRFEVQTATNDWERFPHVSRWKWMDYNAEYDSITAVPKYGDVVWFSIYKDGVVVPGLERFTSHLDVIGALNGLDCGEYELCAHVEADYGGNYSALDTHTQLYVERAENLWKQISHDITFIRGAFDRAISSFTIEPIYGTTVLLSLTHNDRPVEGLEQFTAQMLNDAEIIEYFNALKAGDYNLRAYVEDTHNYTDLELHIPVHIQLTENFWQTTPRISGWIWNEYDAQYNAIIAEGPVGRTNLEYSVIKQDGMFVEGLYNFTEINEDITTRLRWLHAGEYTLSVRIPADEEYAELNAFCAFNVAKAANYWVEMPKVEEWIYGDDANVPTSQPRYGTAQYIVYLLDEDGRETEIVYDSQMGITDSLATAPIGKYRLIAFVEEGSDFAPIAETVYEFEIMLSNDGLYEVAKQNAISTLRLYAQLKGVQSPVEHEYLIRACHSAEEIADALENAKQAVDALVLADIKAKGLARIRMYVNTYNVTCDEVLLEEIERADGKDELERALERAIGYVEQRATDKAIEAAIVEIELYESQKGATCDESIKTDLIYAQTVEDVNRLLETAKSDIDNKVAANAQALAQSKDVAAARLQAYFEGKGVKYDDSYASGIWNATSLEGVEIALKAAMDSAPDGKDGSIKGLVAGLVIAIITLLISAAVVALLFFMHKHGYHHEQAHEQHSHEAQHSTEPHKQEAHAQTAAHNQTAQYARSSHSEAQHNEAQHTQHNDTAHAGAPVPVHAHTEAHTAHAEPNVAHAEPAVKEEKAVESVEAKAEEKHIAETAVKAEEKPVNGAETDIKAEEKAEENVKIADERSVESSEMAENEPVNAENHEELPEDAAFSAESEAAVEQETAQKAQEKPEQKAEETVEQAAVEQIEQVAEEAENVADEAAEPVQEVEEELAQENETAEFEYEEEEPIQPIQEVEEAPIQEVEEAPVQENYDDEPSYETDDEAFDDIGKEVYATSDDAFEAPVRAFEAPEEKPVQEVEEWAKPANKPRVSAMERANAAVMHNVMHNDEDKSARKSDWGVSGLGGMSGAMESNYFDVPTSAPAGNQTSQPDDFDDDEE